MGTKVVVRSSGLNRISINNQQRSTVRTVGISPITSIEQALIVANEAYARANDSVLRTGDTMTGRLNFFTPNTAVGNIQDGNGIDLYAAGGTAWAQLNYANNNFVWVDQSGAFLNAVGNNGTFMGLTDGKIDMYVGSSYWELNANGMSFPDGSVQSTAFDNKVDGGNF